MATVLYKIWKLNHPRHLWLKFVGVPSIPEESNCEAVEAQSFVQGGVQFDALVD